MKADRIITAVPANATAARVTSKGTHYEPVVNYARHAHSDVPPPTRPIPPKSLYTCRDLPGTKFGRFTVIGLAADYNPKKNALWVVRCVCGDYEFRRAKAIRNPANSDDRCKNCDHLELVKKRYKRLGPKAVEEFTEAQSGITDEEARDE